MDRRPSPPPLPIPNGLIRIWIQYEYRKRNSIELARPSLCDAVFGTDEETAGLISAAWQPAPAPDPAPDPDEGPEAKRARLTSELKDPEVEDEEEPEEDNPDIPITPDNNFTHLGQISDYEGDEEPERIEPPPAVVIPDDEGFVAVGVRGLQSFPVDLTWWWIEDHGHAARICRVRDSLYDADMFSLYNKCTLDEIELFKTKRTPLEDADIIELLAFRNSIHEEDQALLKVKLPIKKIRTVTDYWKIKVEMYRDPESEKHLNFQFWRHEEGCLLWTEGEHVRLINRETYQKVAAEYVTAMMVHPKMRFKEMIFDIEPWYKGPAEFPNLAWYTQLRGKLRSALGEKKVKVRQIFTRFCFIPGERAQWSTVTPFLRRKWLKLVTLRLWNDDHVDERVKNRPPPAERPIEDQEGWPKALQSATHLDYRVQNYTKCPLSWNTAVTFRSIQMVDVHWETFDDIVRALKASPPRHRCTITVENELNLKDIKWYFTNNPDVDLAQGYARFQSDTGLRNITIKLQDRKIIIDTERVPDQELDDNDPNDADSDESWTAK